MHTNVQKVDSQAEPTFETRLVFKTRLLLVQSSQTPGLYQGFTVFITDEIFSPYQHR